MSKDFEGVAQIKARFYFQDILGWLKELYASYRHLSRAVSSLEREYDAMVPRCRLRLYCKHRRDSTSFSLVWGKLITLTPEVAKAKRLPRLRVPKELGLEFKPEWAYTIAKRADLRDRFFEFGRRAKALNHARAVVHLAFRYAKTSFIKAFKAVSDPSRIYSTLEPDGYCEVPDLPIDCRALALPAMFDRFIRSAWIAAFSLGLAEEEMSIVAKQVAENPSAADIRLEIAERVPPSFLRRIYWIHLPTGTEVSKLTHVAMRKLRLKEDVRPVLTQKELKRRSIAKSLAKTAKALELLREKCAAAQSSVSNALAGMGKTLILAPNGEEQRAAS